MLALSAEVRNFGTRGRDGDDGRTGRRGRDGENRTIFVDGSPLNLDLFGEDGEDGYDGRDGYDADCGRQPRDVDHDLDAPDGGAGGDGGTGGDGGNGGSLTVYYTNLADLKQIFVQATAGEGGRPGRGAYGGRGCQCREQSWERQTCTGTPGSPGYSCTTRRFYCEDGDDGVQGRDGNDGNDGRLGTLTLINRTQELPPDQPTTTVPMSQLLNRVFPLSKNIWQTRNGAASLLAPGSIIADQYREFVDRIEGSVQVVWNAARPIADFSDQTVTISLEDNKQVVIAFPEEVWVDGTTSQQDGKTQFVATNVILKSEATQLTRADFSGNGTNLVFAVIDRAGKSDLISTQFWIKYRSARSSDRFDRNPDYRTRFEGNIPAELVSRSNNRFALNLGKLPIAPEYLRPGIPVDIELVATRSFAGRSAEQKIEW
ncbi:MAG: collagen-like protein, partial [Coleofasciculus sp. S288]|nr:collagen-like protein [Coleofasciculus sp. S288]